MRILFGGTHAQVAPSGQWHLQVWVSQARLWMWFVQRIEDGPGVVVSIGLIRCALYRY
jgi:hypothetical protein